MEIHLTTYATRRFLHRQAFLGWSAKLSGAVNTVNHWNQAKLLDAGFSKQCPNILLSERGGGWWAWKPFLILHELKRMKDGQWLLYCDVGRTYPLRLIDCPISNMVRWAESKNQSCLPGVNIPWSGSMACWTKRDAFVLTDMDRPEYYSASPIQASFSLWKKCPESEILVEQWLAWCGDRRMVTDDPNTCDLDNLPDFLEHRHDQSLLTLLCLKEGVQALDLGDTQPGFDEKHPSLVAKALGESDRACGIKIQAIRHLSKIVGYIEALLRKFL
jgi:hypothetical protein